MAVISLRIPRELLERIDRYIDSEARGYRTDINRATVTREAIEKFLGEKGFLMPVTKIKALSDRIRSFRLMVLCASILLYFRPKPFHAKLPFHN